MQKRSINSILTISIACMMLAAGFFLTYQRGGILALLGIGLGACLLVKFWFRPTNKDLLLGLTVLTLWSLSWPGIFFYVISTWETGEVVELTIETNDGSHIARTWLLEEPGAQIIYYDAPHLVSEALLSNAKVSGVRGTSPISFEGYTAVPVNDLPEDEVNRLFGLMSEKYGDRNAATEIFYGFLGQAQDRTGIVIKIPTIVTPSNIKRSL